MVFPCCSPSPKTGHFSGQVSWLTDRAALPNLPDPAFAKGQWQSPFRERMYGSWSRRAGGIRLQWRGPRRFFTGFPLSAVALHRERRHLESTYVIPCPGRMKAISGFWIDQPDPQLSPSRIHLDARRKPLELNDLSDEGWSWRRSKELAEARLDLVQKLSA